MNKEINGVEFDKNDLRDFYNWLSSEPAKRFWAMLDMDDKKTRTGYIGPILGHPGAYQIEQERRIGRLQKIAELHQLVDTVRETLEDFRNENSERSAWKSDSIGS